MPLNGDDRWSSRFFAEVSGHGADTALTGYFHFLRCNRGDVAVWTLSYSREANPVVWALSRRANEIAVRNLILPPSRQLETAG
jgi:hypothetical protein